MKLISKLSTTMVAVLPFLVAGCDNGGGSSNTSATSVTYTINTSGGLGGSTGGSGGSGGSVDGYKSAGIGDIEMRASGNADTSFTASTPAAYTGTKPLNVTTNTTITVVTAVPASNTPYLVANDSNLYIADDDATLADADEIVTGISVASGVTLTLPLNYTTYARIDLRNDLANSGMITTADVDATNRGGLQIYPDSYVGASGSSVTTAGTVAGQNGGDVTINADGSLFNHGTINTRGSNGDTTTVNGGDGGGIYLYGNYNFQNTALIESQGGDATGGVAGDGGYVEFQGDYGSMYNSGNVNGYGGNGVTGGNADGGNFSSYIGKTLNSGHIDNHGGNGTGGNGGSGGDIDMQADSGDLINSGNLTTTGGSTTGETFNGGSGGNVDFNGSDGGIEADTPIASILVSGNIDTSGGNAVANSTGSGGSGGSVNANLEVNDAPSPTARLAFLGYTTITTSGGDGNQGGAGGRYQLNNDTAWYDDLDIELPSGNVVNEANLVARGGSAVATATVFPANGGAGGNFTLETAYTSLPGAGFILPEGMSVSDLEKTTNSGTVDQSGGANLKATSDNSGRSGRTWLWGYNGVSNTGAITANGGSDSDTDGSTTGYGGYADDIDMYAETGAVTNSAALTNNGGSGEYRGGRSDGISLYAATVSNNANLTSNGGNANATLAGSVGGNGGWIELFSPQGSAGISHSGTVTYTVGTGTDTTAANSGSFTNGGMCTGYC